MAYKMIIFLLAAPLMACAPPQTADMPEPAPARQTAQETPAGATQAMPDRPYSRGRSFADLDEYLAYLEQANGPIDLPWWREIRPDVFQKMVRMTGAEPETATRDELNRRFGFER